ncbi:MAG: hypothetical protein GF315_05635, partial [candidate division Zixibacteria bacterium]|nr:hypothetical protein [candidate division Zixibacteria bacterium]
MDGIYEYILDDLNLSGKLILDAAVGAAGATYHWTKKISQQGGNSKIIAVDNDFSGGWKEKIKKRLGEYSA